MARVTISIVTHNSERYLVDCLRSIEKQSHLDLEVIVVDNASDDESVKFIRQTYPKIIVLQNFKNLGFCKAHNQAIKLSTGKYFLFLNPDVVLTADYVSRLVEVLDNQSTVGLVAGKLLQWTINDEPAVLGPEILDSTGLQPNTWHNFVDRGQGQADRGQYDASQEVFGLSLAAAMARRRALEDIKIRSALASHRQKFSESKDYYEYLDEDFFMYKDDIDLSWRLRWRGWQCWYAPFAEARHVRGSGINQPQNFWLKIKKRHQRSALINNYSYKNHLLLLLKNDSWGGVWRYGVLIFLNELAKFIYMIFFSPRTLKFTWRVFKQLPTIWYKRRQIQSTKQIRSAELYKWFRS